MAQKLGYFEEAGLDVSIDTPSDPAAPLKLVAAGRSDLAISYEPEVALAREQGLDVVAIAALVNRPLTSLIWLQKSGIKGVADLKGKTIATAGIPYQDAFLKTILARVEAHPDDVKAVNVGFGLLPALRRRLAPRRCSAASATSRASTCASAAKPRSSPRSTSSASRPTTSWSSSPAARAWKPTRRSSASSSPRCERGTEAAVEQPGAATKAILEANPDLEPKLTAAEVEGDAAAARRAHRGAALRLHGPGRVGDLRRLDARQRTDRVAAAAPASCSTTTTCPRAKSPNSRARLRRSAG